MEEVISGGPMSLRIESGVESAIRSSVFFGIRSLIPRSASVER